ncbi:MAG: serine hydrolase [Symbiobacteriia bacterium]
MFAKVSDYLAGAKGTFGVVFDDLTRGAHWEHRPDEPFYAASLIKVPIMVEAFRQAEDGKLDLDRERLTWTRADQVGGDGVVRLLTPGTALSVRDLMMLMITLSDNAATNLLIDRLGKGAIRECLGRCGMTHSSFYNKLSVVPAERQGSNTVTPRDMQQIMLLIAKGQAVSQHACDQMVALLRENQDFSRAVKYLPWDQDGLTGAAPPVQIAHKTGSVHGLSHDVGLFYLPGRTYALSILAKELPDDVYGAEAVAQVSRLVYEAVTGG